MILAVEGASASGKTSWCRAKFPGRHVAEAEETIPAPDLFGDPVEVAEFWVNHATHNWRRALEIEQQHGIAICDGDPLHLSFSWALWQREALSRRLFDIEADLYRQSLVNAQIGFVDRVLWIEVPEDELRRRAHADASRRRKRHEMYLELIPWMKKWFAAREQLLPGTVALLDENTHVERLQPLTSATRYDIRLLQGMLARIQ
jgi:hypothetical protein